MRKSVFIIIVLFMFSACKKGVLKDEQGAFKVNGMAYTSSEDETRAEYVSSNLLRVSLGTGANQSIRTEVQVDLSKINVTVPIDSGAAGCMYVGTNSAVQYFPISGEWKITGHKEGNPLTRFTEGSFSFVAVNQYDNTDTVRITEGYFYVTNY